MPKRILALIAIFIAVFLWGPSLWADETSEAILRLLVKKGVITQAEVDAIRAEIAREKPEVPQDIEERVAVLEDKVKEKGFLSYKGANFQLAGELEYEFLDAQSAATDDDPHFQLDKFVLHPKVKIGDDLNLDAQIYVQEGKTYLNEIHAKISGLPLGSWFDAGLYERWIKSHHDRKTEGYPLIGTAFYRDDALTLTWGGELDPLYWMLSIGNGYELDDKQVAEDGASVSDIIHDDHATSGLSDSLEYGINLGFKRDFGKFGKVDLLGYYYADQLSSADKNFLQANLTGYASDEDDKRRTGAGLSYTLGPALLYAGLNKAADGALDRDAWVAQASYHWKFDTERKWLTGVEPFISYSEYNVDNPKSIDAPLTWDREKWIFALIFDLYKNTKLKAEYYINGEDADGSGVNNDEFLAQLEVKF
jgi:hypothetical protein